MGANNSSERVVPFEPDENDNYTVIPGIQITKRAIKRLIEPVPPPSPPKLSFPTPPQPGQVAAPSTNKPVIPLASPLAPFSTPAPAFVNDPTISPANDSPSSAPIILPVVIEPIISPASPEAAVLPCPPAEPPILLPLNATPTQQHVAPSSDPPLLETNAPCEPVSPPSQPSVETVPADSAGGPKSSSVPPAASAVDEEALKKKITDELQKSLEQDRAKAERELLSWLEAEKARSSAQVQAEAKSHIQSEVSKLLSAERDSAQESAQQAILKEKIAAEDEQRQVNNYMKKLEAKEADLNKQEAFFRDQVARLEERSAQIYKITTDNYHEAADQVNAKYKRYESHPMCADLQGQILACYKENVGKTLLCSGLAAQYLQCVNNAKQTMMRTGG